MKWWGKFWCFLGWHDLRKVYDMTPEEAGKKVAEAKNGWEVMGILFGGALRYKYVCQRCKHQEKP